MPNKQSQPRHKCNYSLQTVRTKSNNTEAKNTSKHVQKVLTAEGAEAKLRCRASQSTVKPLGGVDTHSNELYSK